MKVIDLAVSGNYEGIGHIRANLGGVLDQGIGWINEQHAQETVIKLLDPILSDAFIMIRNAILLRDARPISLILVARSGLYVLYPFPQKGIFKIKGKLWGELDENIRKYRASTENPMKTAVGMARQLLQYFDGHEREHPTIEPILLCADPGAHVDIEEEPPVRVYMRDAIRHVALQISREEEEGVTTEEVIRLAEFIAERRPLPEKASVPLAEDSADAAHPSPLPPRFDDAPPSFLEIEPPPDSGKGKTSVTNLIKNLDKRQKIAVAAIAAIILLTLCMIPAIIFMLAW